MPQLLTAGRAAAVPSIQFLPSARVVDTYDFIEVSISLAAPKLRNPFAEVSVRGEFKREGGAPAGVDGFCDSDDGTSYRIRFMPSQPGDYSYSIWINGPGIEGQHTSSFTARPSRRRGPIRIDRNDPWHFIWEDSGEHYFHNSTTAYWLLGWRDEAIIEESIDRLARLKVNRIRVALSGRTRDGMRWKEPEVKPSEKFQFRLEPWPAARPLDIENPEYDITRFNLEHFRKCERMLRHARDRDMIVSLIFHLDGRDRGVDPFGHDHMGGAEEQAYYRYAIARFGAFANVMWDVSNEYRLFRNDGWAEQMGAFVKECDPYDHLTSVHGHETFSFRTSPWADFAIYQRWDEHGGYDFMLKNRMEQAKTGRPIPQVNEEYGYEDHYPFPWGEGRKWPARMADNRRRLAWEICMAGAYQTTGERANVPGYGGWITGRGNDEMTMLAGYAHVREFFESCAWWTAEPHPELVKGEARCLARPGELYLVYLPKRGPATLTLEPGKYDVLQFNPRSGSRDKLTSAETARWALPMVPDEGDWAFLLTKAR